MSKSTKSRSSRQVSRAELKAYEARRAEEARRISAPQVTTEGSATQAQPQRRVYTLTRDEEYAIIRQDLRRLLMIVGVLVAVLVLATIFLR